MNSYIYEFVLFTLQTAQARNVTIDGGSKYNVPPNEITAGKTTFKSFLSGIGAASSPNLTSHALDAISGADNFNDENVTITDVFDIIVNNTREVSPTCKFPLSAYPIVLLTYPKFSRNRLESWVRTGSIF